MRDSLKEAVDSRVYNDTIKAMVPLCLHRREGSTARKSDDALTEFRSDRPSGGDRTDSKRDRGEWKGTGPWVELALPCQKCKDDYAKYGEDIENYVMAIARQHMWNIVDRGMEVDGRSQPYNVIVDAGHYYQKQGETRVAIEIVTRERERQKEIVTVLEEYSKSSELHTTDGSSQAAGWARQYARDYFLENPRDAPPSEPSVHLNFSGPHSVCSGVISPLRSPTDSQPSSQAGSASNSPQSPARTAASPLHLNYGVEEDEGGIQGAHENSFVL